MPYLLAFRLSMAALLTAGAVMSWVGVDLPVVIGIALIAALAMLVVFYPRQPWWGTQAVELLADRPRVRRETRRDVLYFVAFLVALVIIGTVLGALGVGSGIVRDHRQLVEPRSRPTASPDPGPVVDLAVHGDDPAALA